MAPPMPTGRARVRKYAGRRWGSRPRDRGGLLADRRALVTGGDAGIGRAAAIAFAREGADVAINYLPQEELDAREVMALIRRASGKGFPIPGDIRDEAFCRHLVAEAVRSLGELDILANNAGRQQSHPSILDISTEQSNRTVTPLRRPGQPAERTSIHVQFAADDASYATGQVYGASGGNGLP